MNKQKFAPSINIIRDIKTKFNYIPTPNTRLVYNNLLENFSSGIRAFSLIGNYGTGKSAFLLALEKQLTKESDYFSVSTLNSNKLKSFEFKKIVGEYTSFVQSVARNFGLKKKQTNFDEIFKKIESYQATLQSQNKGLLIVIDEFGKYLEYATKNEPEFELYFIQQLAEYANDHDKNIVLIISLHQDFGSYLNNLDKTQRNEWEKVKGRLKEITFNEPVEQLLYLAAERLHQKKSKLETELNIHALFKHIKKANLFPLKDYFNEEIALKLLPFDILAASVLTLSLQRYGQNDRSLFSFIETNDYLGLRDFDNTKNLYYNLSCVYDYLMYNYFSLLSTRYNPDYLQWTAIRNAIDRAESIIDEKANDAKKLIKTIGLLTMFANVSGKIDEEFLCNYARLSLNVKNPEEILRILQKHKIIRYVKYAGKFILFEGTDIDIESELEKAKSDLENTNLSITTKIKDYFNFPYIPAKAVHYEYGAPRFFGFIVSEEPKLVKPEGQVDGHINLIFSKDVTLEDVKTFSFNCKEAILFGLYNNLEEIESCLKEIDSIKKVRNVNLEDKVVVKELDGLLSYQINSLNKLVMDSLYTSKGSINWYFQGEEQNLHSHKTFNKMLSKIIKTVYPNTPIFRNEMVNKTKLSSPIVTARKGLMRNLLENWNRENIGLPEDRFPPEKSIYLSLVKETGIHKETKVGYIVQKPEESSFQFLWKTSMDFLESAKTNRKNLQEFIDKIVQRPFKLKQGFIDFYLPLFLVIKRDDYALFQNSVFIPTLTDDILELIVKSPKNYEIKTFDIAGIRLEVFNRYRKLLNQKNEIEPSSQSFVETILPFLSFYRQLHLYAKNTKRLSKKTIEFRIAIEKSKDPETTFFEEFPKALGYSLNVLEKDDKKLKQFIDSLQNCIRELRNCYEGLVDRFEDLILKEIIGDDETFPNYRTIWKERYRNIKIHLLLPYQKVFYNRVYSELDERNHYLSSISHACIGKQLEQLSDEDEINLHEKVLEINHELDQLTILSKEDVNLEKEEVFKIEMTSFVEGLQRNLIRIPKTKYTLKGLDL